MRIEYECTRKFFFFSLFVCVLWSSTSSSSLTIRSDEKGLILCTFTSAAHSQTARRITDDRVLYIVLLLFPYTTRLCIKKTNKKNFVFCKQIQKESNFSFIHLRNNILITMTYVLHNVVFCTYTCHVHV